MGFARIPGDVLSFRSARRDSDKVRAAVKRHSTLRQPRHLPSGNGHYCVRHPSCHVRSCGCEIHYDHVLGWLGMAKQHSLGIWAWQMMSTGATGTYCSGSLVHSLRGACVYAREAVLDLMIISRNTKTRMHGEDCTFAFGPLHWDEIVIAIVFEGLPWHVAKPCVASE